MMSNVSKESRQRELSEREEMLLMQFCDGEVSVVRRWLARRLIQDNPSARQFVEEMAVCGDVVRRRGISIDKLLPSSWTMAPAVQGEIEKQECIRRADGEPSRWFPISHELLSRIGWGMTGALTAATVLLYFSPPRQESSGELLFERSSAALDPRGVEAPQLVQPVALVQNSFPRERSRIRLSSDVVRALKSRDGIPQYGVEWFSSGGRLQFIGSQGTRSPVMWVSRGGPRASTNAKVAVIPTVAFIEGAGEVAAISSARSGR